MGARDLCGLVSYTTLACSALSSGFCGLRETRGLVHLLFVIKQLLCCARRTLHPSLLETAQSQQISKGPS